MHAGVKNVDEVVVNGFLPKLSNTDLKKARIHPITLFFNSKDVEICFLAYFYGLKPWPRACVCHLSHLFFRQIILLDDFHFTQEN